MKWKNKTKRALFLAIAAMLFATGCSAKKVDDNNSENNIRSEYEKEDVVNETSNAGETSNVAEKNNADEKSNVANGVMLENVLTGGLQNSLNRRFHLAYDKNYIYFIASKKQEEPKLCRMKHDGSEWQELFELTITGGLWVNNGFLYYEHTGENRIGRINLETLEEEKTFIEIPVSKDIKRGGEVFEAYSAIVDQYCIDNKFIYCYQRAYHGTSSNESIVNEMYNLETGQTTKFNVDFKMSVFAFDGENIYYKAGDSIKIVSPDTMADGKEELVYKEVKVKDFKKVIYYAYNGLIVEQSDGRVVFYSFDDCKKLDDGKIWRYQSVIKYQGDTDSIYDFDKNAEVLYISNSMENMFVKNKTHIEIFKDSQYIGDSNSLDYLTAYGAVGDRVYFIGYDAEGQLVCQTDIAEDKNKAVETIILESVVEEPKQEMVANIPSQYVDLRSQTYDSGNGITIKSSGYSNGSYSKLNIKVNNTTGYKLYVEVDGGLLVNGIVEIDGENIDVVSEYEAGAKARVLEGEDSFYIGYKRALVSTVIEDYISADCVFFKLRFISMEEDEPFEYTTGDLAFIFRQPK